MKVKCRRRILDPILKEAAALAKVAREQLVIVRAEPVVWNDGSLGCPEPGMEYTQALVNGYWVVIEAAGQTYDFRVGAAAASSCARRAVAVRRESRTRPKRWWAVLRHPPLYLNVQQRGCGHLRAKPRQFTVVSNRTAVSTWISTPAFVQTVSS